MPKQVVRALYDYAPAPVTPGDNGANSVSNLTFQKGDIIHVLNRLESGWWDGLCRGIRGWFPSNYVDDGELLREAPPEDQPKTGPWIREIGDRGTIYYFNVETGVTTLETPSSLRPQLEPLVIPRDSGYTSNGFELPEGWIVYEGETGGPVYYNTQTRETRWSRPGGNGSVQASDTDSHGTITPVASSPAMSSMPMSPLSMSSSLGSIGSFSRSRSSSRSGSSAAQRLGHQNEGLPPNWGKKYTLEGRPYYYNMLTDETTWELNDVDPVTGSLRTRGSHRRQASDSSLASDASHGSNRSASSGPSLNMPPSDSNGGDSSVNWSWPKLTNDIMQAIQKLSHSARYSLKEKYIPQSSAIVESIRVMLYASGTARKDAPLVASHKMLKLHHRHIMSSLSNLVLSAKLASGVWPPPDAVAKMQQASNEVLLAVRHFVAAAQDAGVEIRLENGTGEDLPVKDLASAAAAAGDQGRPAAAANRVSVSSNNSAASDGSGNQAQPTNSELIAQLERHSKLTTKQIQHLVTLVRSQQCNSSTLIKEVKSTVTQVGNFLALVDELPLDALSEDLTVDFKVNRLTLYNSISGLVMATQTATSPLAPSNAVEQVLLSTGLVEKAAKDLLISTKFLVEEKEAMEQLTLQNYIEQYGQQRRFSDITMRPRRAMSLSIIGPPGVPLTGIPEAQGYNAGDRSGEAGTGDAATSTPSAAPAAESPSPPRPMMGRSMSSSAIPVNQGGAVGPSLPTIIDNEAAPTLDRKTSKAASKIQQILGAEAPQKARAAAAANAKPERPWFLGYDYPSEDIVFSMEGKVKGGRLKALIERLTLHDALDADFTLTFLLTYRSFTTSPEFIRMVLDRFSMPTPTGLTPEQEQQWVSQKLTPVRLRVFNVLKNWLENYALDTDSNDVLAVDMVRVFAEETMKEIMASAAAQLLRILNKMTLNGGNASTRKLVQNNRECPPPILPRNLNRIKFLELDPLEVARQLTVMESGLYARIMPSEFLKQAWSETAGDKEGKGKSVNVRAMIATSNQITGWVASSILMEKDLKKRSQIMKQFIYIADRCRNLNNFNTLMSIIAGLNSAPIHRLKRTWDQLSQRSMAILDALRQTMRREKNFSVYRETLHSANPPCVPFLGFYLTDLTFIEEGNPDMLNGNGKSILAQRQSDSSNPNGLINFSKRMKTAEVIREIQQYQNVGYLLQTVPELQHWLRSCLRDAGEMESNGLWDISMTLEPREREDEKIARLLQESGFL
ncbi:hypothetical protein HDU85_006591 [Gaertneriomyces sp. JEL0708]|nr:hypothetical protein HDU85_006591 [Gaertneriomyces sp. JEL0708]